MCVCVWVLLGVVSPLQAQRQDLIAELKMSKDINGIKQMKVEKVKMEEMSEKQKINEITKQLSPDNIIDQVRIYFNLYCFVLLIPSGVLRHFTLKITFQFTAFFALSIIELI